MKYNSAVLGIEGSQEGDVSQRVYLDFIGDGPKQDSNPWRRLHTSQIVNFISPHSSVTIARLAKSVRCNHTTGVVVHRVSKQIIVLLFAVFVTAGMSLSVVQASAMDLKMMDMASSMTKSSDGGCKDCGGPGDSKAMATCAASGCVGPAAADSPLQLVLDMASATIYHPYPDLSLLGLDSRPEPYPPRTSNIG